MTVNANTLAQTIKTEEAGIQKDLLRARNSGMELTNNTEMVEIEPVKPQLLSVLMGAYNAVNRMYFSTRSFEYDEKSMSVQLPSVKNYNERGEALKKDGYRTLNYRIPSKGLVWNVAPEDVAGRRKPGSTAEFMQSDDLIAEMNIKAAMAWDLDNELDLAQLLTLGTNRTGSPFTSYDFHNDILGTARTVHYMDLANDDDPDRTLRKKLENLDNRLKEYGLSASRYVVICGSNYFDERYEAERQETLPRPLVDGLDFMSQEVPYMMAGGFNYATFTKGSVTYINYGSEIIAGNKLIPTDKAYVIPVIQGDSMIRYGYAPMSHDEYVNTQALEMYSFEFYDPFQGRTAFFEQNRLTALVRPDLILELDKGTAP